MDSEENWNRFLSASTLVSAAMTIYINVVAGDFGGEEAKVALAHVNDAVALLDQICLKKPPKLSRKGRAEDVHMPDALEIEKAHISAIAAHLHSLCDARAH